MLILIFYHEQFSFFSFFHLNLDSILNFQIHEQFSSMSKLNNFTYT